MKKILFCLALAAALAAAGCAPVLRQSVCVVPQQGMQVCQFAYEGDPAPE